MLKFLLNRLGQSVILLLIVTIITFFLINLAPGEPAGTMRMDASPEERQAIVERLGLDQPIHLRYLDWVKNAVQGDLGVSFTSSEPVVQRIADRLPYTIELTAFTIIFSIFIGILLGVISAINRGKLQDHVINFISVMGLSLPAFWLGLMLIYLFSITLGWLPSSGVLALVARFQLFGVGFPSNHACSDPNHNRSPKHCSLYSFLNARSYLAKLYSNGSGKRCKRIYRSLRSCFTKCFNPCSYNYWGSYSKTIKWCCDH